MGLPPCHVNLSNLNQRPELLLAASWGESKKHGEPGSWHLRFRSASVRAHLAGWMWMGHLDPFKLAQGGTAPGGWGLLGEQAFLQDQVSEIFTRADAR